MIFYIEIHTFSLKKIHLKMSSTKWRLFGLGLNELTGVSLAYGGNTADRYIVRESGCLELIEPGDDVMADRGFTIRDLLLQKDATLTISVFTRKCKYDKVKRLNVNEVQQTKAIVNLRIHIERAIDYMKGFRIPR